MWEIIGIICLLLLSAIYKSIKLLINVIRSEETWESIGFICLLPFIAIYEVTRLLMWPIKRTHSKMPINEKVKSVSSKLNQLPQRVQTCHELAQTLIETNHKLTQTKAIWKIIAPTEYDRARKQIISTCNSAAYELESIRRGSLSVDAIRAVPMIKNIIGCCERCLYENQKNIDSGQSFYCLLETTHPDRPTAFRFILDKKGQIIEQS